MPWGAGDNHGGVRESGLMMGRSTLRRSWWSRRGIDPMMRWDWIIGFGQDGMWIIKIGLRIRQMSELDLGAFWLWALIGRGLVHFVYKVK